MMTIMDKGDMFMYLLELHQFNTKQVVGLFETEADVKSCLHEVEGIKVDKEVLDDVTFENYYLDYNDLPKYQEVYWQESQYVLSRYTFTSDEGDIVAVWNPIEVISDVHGRVSGQTRVGAYVIDNDEVESYINAFEEMKAYLIDYFEQAHHDVGVYGQESEDGAYLEVDGQFCGHLEGYLVDEWQNKLSKTAFIETHFEDLNNASF